MPSNNKKPSKKVGKRQVRNAAGFITESLGKGHQVQIIPRYPLKVDEFTEDNSIKNILVKFAEKVSRIEDVYQTNMKQSIRTVAIELENRLRDLDRSHLVPMICNELISILKQIGSKYHPNYIRRCLDEKYKNPINRLSALARKKAEPILPGIPQDSGRSEEELAKALERKQMTYEELEKTFEKAADMTRQLANRLVAKAKEDGKDEQVVRDNIAETSAQMHREVGFCLLTEEHGQKMMDELKARPPAAGEYVVRTKLIHKVARSGRAIRMQPIATLDEETKYHDETKGFIWTLPLVIKCNPKEQGAKPEFDVEEYKKMKMKND